MNDMKNQLWEREKKIVLEGNSKCETWRVGHTGKKTIGKIKAQQEGPKKWSEKEYKKTCYQVLETLGLDYRTRTVS